MTPFTPYLCCWWGGAVLGYAAAAMVLTRRRALSATALAALGLFWAGLAIGAKWQFRLEHLPPLAALAMRPAELLEPGKHLPLGLVVGLALALVYARWRGAEWRGVGDAIAVGAACTVAIGRLGCFVAGCCTGTVCGRWALPLCMTFPPGSAPYTEQLVDHLIPVGGPVSLPAHPLPLYFSAAALALMGMLLLLLRRDVEQGVLLLVFAVVYPATQLLLEPLRAAPPDNLQRTTLALMCTGSGAALVKCFVSRTPSRRASHRSSPSLASPSCRTDCE